MLVTFVRHAEAVSDVLSDFERQLTKKGRQQAARIAAFFASTKRPPQLILSSPLMRARQTAEAIERELKSASLLEQPWLACGMNPEVCLSELGAFTRFESILLTGHEPDLSKTIAFLLGIHNSENLHVRKASVCALEIRSLRPAAATLEYFLPPEFLPSLP